MTLINYIRIINQLEYRGVDYCAGQGAEIATIPDEFSQAWAYSQLADPSENPELALPVGQTGWIGLRKRKDESSYQWMSGWCVDYMELRHLESITIARVCLDARLWNRRRLNVKLLHFHLWSSLLLWISSGPEIIGTTQ